MGICFYSSLFSERWSDRNVPRWSKHSQCFFLLFHRGNDTFAVDFITSISLFPFWCWSLITQPMLQLGSCCYDTSHSSHMLKFMTSFRSHEIKSLGFIFFALFLFQCFDFLAPFYFRFELALVSWLFSLFLYHSFISLFPEVFQFIPIWAQLITYFTCTHLILFFPSQNIYMISCTNIVIESKNRMWVKSLKRFSSANIDGKKINHQKKVEKLARVRRKKKLAMRKGRKNKVIQ